MRLRHVLLMTLGLSALAADADFNGRWNIRVNTPRGRVWWLEVNGAGTPALAGKFVGAPGGQVDVIPELKIESGELRFVFERRAPAPGQSQPVMTRQVYRARFKDGRLAGTLEVEAGGEKRPSLPWVGIRAPQIRDREDGSWQPAPAVSLLNGKDTTGWRLLTAGRPGWKVANGLLQNEQGASDLVSEAKYWNFILRAEYRYGKGSNSGIGVRGRYEVQIIDDFGKPPDGHSQGALYSRVPPAVNASLAPGEWQSMELRIVGRTLTVTLNGKRVLDKVEVEGVTAICMDPEEDQPGPIVLQGDHGLVEFRKLEVTPLVRGR
jgi:hypothetical protein